MNYLIHGSYGQGKSGNVREFFIPKSGVTQGVKESRRI